MNLHTIRQQNTGRACLFVSLVTFIHLCRHSAEERKQADSVASDLMEYWRIAVEEIKKRETQPFLHKFFTKF